MDKKEFIITIAKEIALGYKPYQYNINEICNGFSKIAKTVENTYDAIKTDKTSENRS